MIEFQVNDKLIGSDTPQISELFDQFLKSRTWGFTQLVNDDKHWNQCQVAGQEIQSHFKHLVVVGMGGSSLGSAAFIQALAPNAAITFWNSSDPELLESWKIQLTDIHDVHWLVISKSGNTLETCILSNFAVQQIDEAGLSLSKHMSVITEAKDSTLYSFAKANNLTVYPHRSDIGGRFSVFTNVGMIPCAFAGLSLTKIRQGLRELEQNKTLVVSLIGAAEKCFENNLSSLVIWPYSQKLKRTSDWITQIWSESLGKSTNRNGAAAPKAALPSICTGAISQHSILQQLIEGPKDHWVLFFTLDNNLSTSTPSIQPNWTLCHKKLQNLHLGEVSNIQAHATYDSLIEAGAFCSHFNLGTLSETNLSQLLYLFEWTIALLGERLNIDAFTQPGVERGKIITKSKLNIG